MRVVVIGGGVGGSAAAIFLSRRGHEVTVLESDPTPPPADPGSEELWSRKGTPQGRHPHAFHGGGLRALRAHAPHILQRMVGEGGILRAVDELWPASLPPRDPEPGDDDILALNARRSFFEAILRQEALASDGVTYLSGTHVKGLQARDLNGRPHVTGAVADDGQVFEADLVLDAAGRRSMLDRWLPAIGARPPVVVTEPCGQVYFSRNYRLLDGVEMPALNSGFVAVSPMAFGASLMFPGDNGTMQFAVGCLPNDALLSAVRDDRIFHSLISFMPAMKPFVEVARPISDAGTMGAFNNHLRRLVVDGQPIVTGLLAIGDTVAITNPQYGRGIGHALMDAALVTEMLEDGSDDPVELMRTLDREIERMRLPSYENSAATDRGRTAVWTAAINGDAPAFVDDQDALHWKRQAALFPLMSQDASVWRVGTRGGQLLEPPGSWRSMEGLLERLDAMPPQEPPPMPSRREVADVIEAALAKV